MKALTLILSLIVLFSCKQEFINVYKKNIEKPSKTYTSPDEVVSVGFNARIYKQISNPTPKKTIFNLTEKAQSKLIESYAKIETKSSDKLSKAIAKPLELEKKKSQKAFNEDRLIVPVQLTLMIKNNWAQADLMSRVVELHIQLELNNKKMKFVSFDGFQTQYEYYNFGSLEGTTTRNFSISPEFSATPSATKNTFDDQGNTTDSNSVSFGPKISGTLGGSNSVTQKINPRYRTIAQTGLLSDNSITAYLEGQPQKDLDGPIVIKVKMTPLDNQIEAVSYLKQDLSDKSNPKFSSETLIKPDDNIGNVDAQINVGWLYRRVVKNGQTPHEGDDHIELYFQAPTQYHLSKTLISQNDLKVETFELHDKNKVPAYLEDINGKQYLIRFLSRNEAKEFREYVLNKGNTFGNYKLLDNTKNLIAKKDIPNTGISPEKH